MARLSVFVLLFICKGLHAQISNSPAGKLELYFLKDRKPNLDNTKQISSEFLVTISDLADTPFIKDQEILKYIIRNDSIKDKGKTVILKNYQFKVAPSLFEKFKNENIPLCCGKQFALVVNGKIVFSGYFWNILSSFGCDAITAYLGQEISIQRRLPDYSTTNDPNDPRANPFLINCLKSGGRLEEE